MEQLFGSCLVKWNNDALKAPATDAEEPAEVPSCYTSIPLEESLNDPNAYIAVLFTAEFAPPCVSFLQTFTAFCNEANKDPAKKKFEVLVVNCDRTEEEYKTHIQKMHPAWYNIPFEATKVMERIEDVAKASTIPRVCVIKPSATLEEPILSDIKPIILRNQNMEAAVKELVEKLDKI